MEPVGSILVVDDQPGMRKSISLTLEAAGYDVTTAEDGLKALAALETRPVDLILADVAMPGLNGYQLFERVRQNPHWLPISFIFLTARSLDSDIRFGKELGVDDYLTKPIQPEDLIAVVSGKLRRARQLAQATVQGTLETEATARPDPNFLVVGKLRIDPDQHRVWLDDQALRLSAREFILLACLASRPGAVLSPPELIEATHDLRLDSAEAGALLRPLIRTLRRKLGQPVGGSGCIENVRGVGYRLIKPDSVGES